MSAAAARIRPLPAALAHQIAAGEVVERPASVVKELVENSLDAGARRIDIELEQGGARLIRVRDDGSGVHKDDLALALTRHATSKIRSLAELEAVASLGFRGEALPSIASVSRLELCSRTRGEALGYRIGAEEGGPVGKASPHPHPEGTTVSVRDLFYNTPARRKFLRTERTEVRHVEEVVRRLALARFDVAFRLGHEGRQLLRLERVGAGGAIDRLSRLCRARFCEQALAVEFEREGLRLQGWLGLPSAARAQGDVQYFFLNGRAVRDAVVAHAVRQAYEDRLSGALRPSYVLYLEIDPRQVDVNVHPMKHEVRFREARLVHDFLHRSLRSALEQGLALEPTPAEDAVSIPGCGALGPSAAGTASSPAGERGPHRAPPAAPSARAVAEQLESYEALARGGRAPASAEIAPGARGPLGQALGVAHGEYLVAEVGRGVALLHLPGACRALARARLRRAARGGALASRPLLVPAAVTVAEASAARLERCAPDLARFGLELDLGGPQSVTVRALPVAAERVEVARLVQALCACLDSGAALEGEAVLDALAEASAVPAATETEALDELLRSLEAEAVDVRSMWTEIDLGDIEARRGRATG